VTAAEDAPPVPLNLNDVNLFFFINDKADKGDVDVDVEEEEDEEDEEDIGSEGKMTDEREVKSPNASFAIFYN